MPRQGPGASRPRRAQPDGPEVPEIGAALASGALIALATETLWGFSADPFSEDAIRRLASVKGRISGKGFLVLVSSLDDLERLGVGIGERMASALGVLWPAPVTVILPALRILPAAAPLTSLAVRIPADERLRNFLGRVGPLASTSANREGEAPSRSASEIDQRFGDQLAWIVGEGPQGEQRPSTLVDATAEVARIIRRGAGDPEAERFVWYLSRMRIP
jgi:tRNA threonylcarbamoyl adenosine modification protein (Sua5/YciO/YrdC/YwlC family)